MSAKRRMAPTTHGEAVLSASARRSASPRRVSSSALRNRSRLVSPNFSTWRHGFEPSGRWPWLSHQLKNFDSSATEPVRLIWLVGKGGMQARNVAAGDVSNEPMTKNGRLKPCQSVVFGRGTRLQLVFGMFLEELRQKFAQSLRRTRVHPGRRPDRDQQRPRPGAASPVVRASSAVRTPCKPMVTRRVRPFRPPRRYCTR